MGLFDWLAGKGHSPQELARRLDVEESELTSLQPRYTEFIIPKRAGGERSIQAPEPELKQLQQRINRRLLARLRSHECAVGFERGHSIASNAAFHANRAVVVRMDIRGFFPSTYSKRVRKYFRKIGWNRPAAKLLTNLCTFGGGLPQGAPTSPRLSNLVNFGMDVGLARLAAKRGARYSRYADDMVFSFAEDDSHMIQVVISGARAIARRCGYSMHHRKLSVRRRHQRQQVTGLVVNEIVNLPRHRRRWLRAVEHRMRTRGEASLTKDQLAGWHALQSMIEQQR